MPRILMTGAAGGIGTSLRKLLPPIYPDLLLSDITAPADLGKDEKFKAADLADLAQVEAVCEGIEGILHFGGFSVEGPWDTILQSNIIGCYNLFEAARKQGVKRIVFASSNHAVGFYPRHHRIGTDVTARPDSRYGVSKVFGEAVGALYADKHGLGVTCIRIGNFGEMPLDHRRLSIWLKLSAVERLTTGLRWAEGPVWFGDGRYLLCSDIPNQRILKWEEETGAVSIFRKPSNSMPQNVPPW